MASADISEILRGLDEGLPNVTEFLLFNKPLHLEDELQLEVALTAWANLYGHTVRLPSRRNPFEPLSLEGANSFIHDRLTKDIVFGTSGLSEKEAADLAKMLLSSTGAVRALATSFLIEDWTFCDFLAVSCRHGGFFLAFLGED
jgi:hypothetical protein